MQYCVIFQVDTFGDNSIAQFRPRVGKWDMTERDDTENDYGERGKHRKFCAMLTRREFDKFVNDAGLYPEDVETLGRLGAPGIVGLAPAISFRNEVYDEFWHIMNAYVTPIPDTSKRDWNENDWQRIRRAVISKYR